MKLWFKTGAWASKKAIRVAKQIQPEEVKSVAVIRHAAVGDMVLTRPFLIELRRFFPNAKITLSLCSNYTRGAPEDLVDRVHVVYGSDQRGIKLKQQIRRAKELGDQDLLFDLTVTSRSTWLCLLTRAKLKVSFPYHNIQRYVFYDIAVSRSDMRFEAENVLEMLNILGHATQYPPVFDMQVEAAVREGELANISMEDRFDQLLIHGILHLFGYDHEKSEQDAQQMEKKSDELLDVLSKKCLK